MEANTKPGIPGLGNDSAFSTDLLLGAERRVDGRRLDHAPLQTVADLSGRVCDRGSVDATGYTVGQLNRFLAWRQQSFRDASLFVWACWFTLSLGACVFIFHYASNAPYWDELSVVAVLTHNQPVTVQWLWSQANEHRIPLPRLILVGLARLSGTDFRAGMYLNALLMSCLAAIMIVTARGIRGRSCYTDAFFPIALLNWGHYENLLWSFQVAFSCSTFLVCVFLVLIVTRGPNFLTPDGSFAAGPALVGSLCLLLLPLCGAMGTVLVPPLGLWLGWAGIRSLSRDGWTRWKSMPSIALVLLAFATIGLYFLTGYYSPPWHPPPPNLRAWVVTSGEFLCAGLGSPAVYLLGHRVFLVAGVLSTVVVATLVSAWFSQPSERPRLAAMGLFLFGFLALAIAIGKGRAFQGEAAGLAPRYGWLAAPFAIGLYLAVGRWGRPPLSRFVQFCFFLAATLIVLDNYKEGQIHARVRRAECQVLMTSVRAGMTNEEIFAQCGKSFFCDKGVFIQSLEFMRNARVGPFADK
jgi:hypothetical protein